MFELFEKLPGRFPKTSLLMPPKQLGQFSKKNTQGYKKYFLIILILTAATAGLELVILNFLGALIDLLNSQPPNRSFIDDHFNFLAIAAIAVCATPVVVLLHSFLINQTLSGNLPITIIWRSHLFLLGQSMKFFQKEFAGRLSAKLLQTAYSVKDLSVKLLDTFVHVAVFVVGGVLTVAKLEIIMMLPIIVWIAVFAGALIYYMPRLSRASAAYAHANSELAGKLVDSYTNINIIKLFAYDDRESSYAKRSMENTLECVYQKMRIYTKLKTTVTLINSILILAVGLFAVILWSTGDLTAGAMATAIAVTLRIGGLSHWIMWEVHSFFENIGVLQDGINAISQPLDISNIQDASTLKAPITGVKFSNVNFSYDRGVPVLKDFSLCIRPSEKIGIVGRSGSGKTTLINLLVRFFDVDSGSIEINNKNIKQFTQESLRENISVVSQDTSLLHRTIRENIAYGKPQATEEEIVRASRAAFAHEFISMLASGYDTQVGERGIKLSNGQRQRVAIARAFLKDAPILILDEATSALDSEVETSIQASLSRLMERRTVIAIAHRLSTISHFDRLVVIDDGAIVEQGTHSELLRQGGIYAKLWESQSGNNDMVIGSNQCRCGQTKVLEES